MAITTQQPGEGPAIGAGIAYLFAVPLSVVASLRLLRSRRTTAAATSPSGGNARPTLAGRAKATLAVAASALAVAAVVTLPVVLVAGATDLLTSDVLDVLLFTGLGAFLISTLLFGVLRS